VKTAAAVAPNGGQVEETVTRKRILPAEAVGAQKTPEFWPYFEAIRMDDWSPYRHKLFLYRYKGQDPVGSADFLEKNESGVLTLANGDTVQLNNREDTEFAIAQRYGGGLFRLILKRGSERITETRVSIDQPRKAIPAMQHEASGPTISTMGDATAEVAHHAINTIAGQERLAVDVGVNALRSAAEVVQRFSQPQPPVNSEMDQMFRGLMVRMMERMLNPPAAADPIDLLTKVMTLQQQLNPSGQGNPLVSRIMDSAVENLLKPQPSGPVVSAAAELVRQLPSVAQYATQAIHEWRMGSEAQRDTAAIMAGGKAVTPPAGRPVTQPSVASATILPPVGTAAPVNAQANGAPSFEFIESRIVNIMGDSETVEEAAERCFEYLADTDKNVIPQLAGLGEQGLMQFFCSRPTLKPVTVNVPKLQEFLRAFLKCASEADGATAASLKPN